ncbi:sucrase ferredoxin [Modestobacter sp. NPDC049651]|uniref:sucrase ferredoxin n=1 Tax=unclassified Modestobacter TaxID=2643866 RepID=UPI003411632E
MTRSVGEDSPDFCQEEPVAPARPAGRLDAGRCSVQALLRGDAVTATAPPARRWLLVEQPGPWGPDALLGSRFDPAVARPLAARARAAGVRIQLVRRPGGRLGDSGMRWAIADTTPGVETVWWSTREADADLLEVAWDGSVGEPSAVPTYLVCTHGAHDACCAVRGRPLAQGLTAAGAAEVWETSHLGGDRFAANVLVLPTGHVYGQVPADGAELVAAHSRGEVALPWLRGRAGWSPAAQAAQQCAREELGLLGVHDLDPREVDHLPSPATGVDRWAVTLAGPDGDVLVTVESRPSEVAALTTCRALHPVHWRTWHLVSLTPSTAPVAAR